MEYSCNPKFNSADIQNVLDAARPGEVIRFAPGTYSMDKTLNLPSGITVSGEDKADLEARPGCLVVFRAFEKKSVTVRGFRFSCHDSVEKFHYFLDAEETLGLVIEGNIFNGGNIALSGVWVNHCSSVRVEGNNCHENLRAGIGLSKSQADVLNNNSWGNTLYGIVLEGSSSVRVEGNDCHENLQTGIALFKSQADILNNNSWRNTHSGISLQESSSGKVKGNDCHENLKNGIYLFESQVEVLNNNSWGNTLQGILLRDSSSGRAEGNDCHENLENGITLFKSRVKVLNNNSWGNTYSGISLQDSSSGKVEGNNCHENLEDGITLFKSQADVLNNNSWGNTYSGILLRDSSSGWVEGNDCHENLYNGITLFKSQADILNNNSWGNTLQGILLRDSSSGWVEGNDCHENLQAGIGLSKSQADILNNNSWGNTLQGILLQDSSSGRVKGNDCHENLHAGIALSKSQADILNNNSWGNTLQGIALQDSSSGRVEGNDCHENLHAGIALFKSQAEILNNNSWGNTLQGILLKDSSSGRVEGNTLYSNVRCGIFHHSSPQDVQDVKLNFLWQNTIGPFNPSSPELESANHVFRSREEALSDSKVKGRLELFSALEVKPTEEIWLDRYLSSKGCPRCFVRFWNFGFQDRLVVEKKEKPPLQEAETSGNGPGEYKVYSIECAADTINLKFKEAGKLHGSLDKFWIDYKNNLKGKSNNRGGKTEILAYVTPYQEIKMETAGTPLLSAYLTVSGASSQDVQSNSTIGIFSRTHYIAIPREVLFEDSRFSRLESFLLGIKMGDPKGYRLTIWKERFLCVCSSPLFMLLFFITGLSLLSAYLPEPLRETLIPASEDLARKAGRLGSIISGWYGETENWLKKIGEIKKIFLGFTLLQWFLVSLPLYICYVSFFLFQSIFFPRPLWFYDPFREKKDPDKSKAKKIIESLIIGFPGFCTTKLIGESLLGNRRVWQAWAGRKLFRHRKGVLAFFPNVVEWGMEDEEAIKALIDFSKRRGRGLQILLQVPSVSMLSSALVDPFLPKKENGKNKNWGLPDRIEVITRDRDQMLNLPGKEDGTEEKVFKEIFNSGGDPKHDAVERQIARRGWSREEIITALVIGSPPTAPVVLGVINLTESDDLLSESHKPPFPAANINTACSGWRKLFGEKNPSPLTIDQLDTFRSYAENSAGIIFKKEDGIQWHIFRGMGGHRNHLAGYLWERIKDLKKDEGGEDYFSPKEYLTTILACAEWHFLATLREKTRENILEHKNGAALCLESALFVREERILIGGPDNFESIDKLWRELAEEVLICPLDEGKSHIARRFALSFLILEDKADTGRFPGIEEMKTEMKEPWRYTPQRPGRTIKDLFLKEWTSLIKILLSVNEETAGHILDMTLTQEWSRLPAELKGFLKGYLKDGGAVQCLQSLRGIQSGEELIDLTRYYVSRPIMFLGCLGSLILTWENDRAAILKELLIKAKKHSFQHKTGWQSLPLPSERPEVDLSRFLEENFDELCAILKTGREIQQWEEVFQRSLPKFDFKGIASGKITATVDKLEELIETRGVAYYGKGAENIGKVVTVYGVSKNKNPALES